MLLLEITYPAAPQRGVRDDVAGDNEGIHDTLRNKHVNTSLAPLEA